MEEIANMVNQTPEKATELVDTKVFDALTNIVKLRFKQIGRPNS